jgi:hypothetical protein
MVHPRLGFRRSGKPMWLISPAFDPTIQTVVVAPHRSGAFQHLAACPSDTCMIAVILQAANTLAALAFWPPNDVVTRLCGGDFTLNTRQQKLRLGKGQPQVGDIANAIRPPDLHEVRA